MNDLTTTSSNTWQILLSLGGGVAAVGWAYHYNHPGKVWIFLGGMIVGGGIGYLIDNR